MAAAEIPGTPASNGGAGGIGAGGTAGTSAAAPATGVQPQAVQLQFRDTNAKTVYANICRVGGTPDEAFIELATHQPQHNTQLPVANVEARVFMNYYVAKGLALQLSQVIQRYEQTYGVLELDPRRRVRENRPANQ